MSSAYRWLDAWHTIDEELMNPYNGMREYELPNGDKIYPGDRFWMPEESYIIEVDEVRTKVYQGVVAPKGEKGQDCVFYTPDWKPVEFYPEQPPHYTDDIHWMTVSEFAEKLDDEELIAHRGNGLPPLP